MFHIQSFLSARLFLQPQLVNDEIFFLSNISGHISLYKMRVGGSVPQPLIPPQIALQNPHLMEGKSFQVFPKLGMIVVMIDANGNEVYQPMFIPIDGGFPEPIFNHELKETRSHLGECDIEKNICFLSAESLTTGINHCYLANLKDLTLKEIYSSEWGCAPVVSYDNYEKILLFESYSAGDIILKEWNQKTNDVKTIFGTPLGERISGQDYPLTGINAVTLTPKRDGVIITSAIFDDKYSPGLLRFGKNKKLIPIDIEGLKHEGTGELEGIESLTKSNYVLKYNIDGATWLYEVKLGKNGKKLQVKSIICGKGKLSNGVLESYHYDRDTDRFVISFSSAISPSQLYLISGKDRKKKKIQTREQVLGINKDFLSAGEDASFTAEDGLRISSRLYLPSPETSYAGPRPLIYYVHGGPQGQERPDFAWFSMPLIQFLTLNGFAVFVPNVRGSTGYGLTYTKHVDRDWGGKDRLDHVYAMKLLSKDDRIDTSRTGVVGRSYGGYMTLMLAGRHPELWKAAVDMFGPYDLLTFLERIPESWKPYMKLALGDVKADRKFLIERSPKTYLSNLACPLLVIQGKNDPRVVVKESEDLVNKLRKEGKKIDFIVFENEGHDVLKLENRLKCYDSITEFFKMYLQP